MTEDRQTRPHLRTEYWQRLQHAVLYWLLIISGGGLAFLTIFIFVLAPRDRDRMFISLVSLIIVAVSWYVLRQGHMERATHIVIIGVGLVLYTAPFTGAGVYATAYYSHVVLIMLSGIYYKTRITALITGGSIVLGGILVAAAESGVLTSPTNVPLAPTVTWISISIMFVLAASLIVAVRIATQNVIDQIERERTFYRTIISDQTEFIVRWKPDGTRTFANDAYCRYFGLTSEKAIGTGFLDLIAEKDRPRFRAKLKRLTPNNPVEIDQHEVINPDGTIGWQQWSDRAIFDVDGNLTEYQSVGRDITALMELEQHQLDLKMAQRREQFLRDFLNMISHDLKTPLTIIENNLYLIRHVSVAPAVEKHANRISRQLDHLTGLINDILTIARLENVESLELGPIALSALIGEAMTAVEDVCEARDVQLVLAKPLPATTLRADDKYLKRALVNLLENAVKYSPRGSYVTIAGSSDGEQRATISISDSGIGIGKEDLPYIFESFYRARSVRETEKGTGLGLAIVDRIVELHGGSINVESAPGKGSTFTVKLPLYQEKNVATASD